MDLSILIPIYNFDVTSLVRELSGQIIQEQLSVEIICFDDGSDSAIKAQNKKLEDNSLVRYEELPTNLGRAAIRNKLALAAKATRLLFLDCDSGLVSTDFLKTYLAYQDQPVVSGGRIYSPVPPAESNKILHWKYGTYNESLSANKRNKRPFIYFHSNNFCIAKNLFLETGFNEDVKGYGYEDLLLAKAIKDRNIAIHHIDNPVEHLDIETNIDFLTKTLHAVENLRKLNASNLNMQTRLELAAQKIQRFGLSKIYLSLFRKREERLRQNLLSAKPNLKLLSFYKLNHYLKK